MGIKNTFINRLLESRFARDSFWSIFGNGMGNALLLLSGIIIARLLGKNLYGEYGMVKTTMFYIAAFSTLGLGYTSTKFIAESVSKKDNNANLIASSSMGITIVSSIALCLLLCIFSQPLANFINTPSLAKAFQYLGIILVAKAISTTQIGILSGHKLFKAIGVSCIVSGLVLFITCIPMTYYWSLRGSLLALILSQVVLCCCNQFVLRRIRIGKNSTSNNYIKLLLKFSVPVAMQELSYMLCNWGSMLLITKYANIGELGLYTAATQWGSVILMIPSLLQNVFLSYLSSTTSESNNRSSILRKIVLVNLICTSIPFFIILLCSGFICSFYGVTFTGLQFVLNVYALSTIFTCLNNVYQANLLAQGHNWLLFMLRTSRDCLMLLGLYYVLQISQTKQTALHLSIINVIGSAIFLAIFIFCSKYVTRKDQGLCL
jgi:O-antigen/teichoic acid export membrane protein